MGLVCPRGTFRDYVLGFGVSGSGSGCRVQNLGFEV